MAEKRKVIIKRDRKSGFCFGVNRAIEMAESNLTKNNTIVSLGDIVHNDTEINRLNKMGMKSVPEGEVEKIEEKKVLFRAHGEPPESYKKAKKRGLTIVDATCPVVLKLQQRVKIAWQQMEQENGQVVIFGQIGHAEIKGLLGHTNNKAIIVENEADIKKLNPKKRTILFSQTTKSYTDLEIITEKIKAHLNSEELLTMHNTICAQVGNRIPHLKKFAAFYDIIIFVAGSQSSNGKVLYEVCKKNNKESYLISNPNDIKKEWFTPRPHSIGICGATSTPHWLMKKTEEYLNDLLNE
ncbi:4-hydroxy-3-methylbut-2-enyl diphosphate reductase [Marinilabiliaceae bacterium ANBcel2]|nr:4-hydroxy-3-methylbut-2-enyl diphosphate reductase [Marinilabiliaceae bacterium ANBcel2]